MFKSFGVPGLPQQSANRLGRPKQQNCIVSVLEAGSQRSRCWQGGFPVRPWLTFPLSSHHLSSVSLCPNFLFIRTPRLLIRACSNDLIHNLITSAKTLSPSVCEFGEGEGLGLQRGLPWWLSGRESTCQCRRRRFDPRVRKIPWRRKWQPTPVFLPGRSQGQRNLAGYSPWGHKSQT